MTTLEYMEKQLRKHRLHLEHEVQRNAPPVILQNISVKIRCYTEAIEALKERNNNEN